MITILLLHSCKTSSVAVNYFDQDLPGELPKKFAPGIISRDDRFELMSVYAPDGKEFCFSVTNEHWSHFEIWHTLFDGHKWSEPRKMPLPIPVECFGPAFSTDGKRLYFSLSNWVTHPSTIWYSDRQKDGWSVPVKADSLINSGADQWQCSVASDGTLIFASKRSGGKGDYDLYLSEPNAGLPNKVSDLAELNSPSDEYSAFIAPDKSYIIFSSQCTGGYGWDDLYISFRKKAGGWTNPINLGPDINTIHAEFAPQVTPDGKYLLYSKWDKNNKWSDIYWVRIDKIIERLKKDAGIH